MGDGSPELRHHDGGVVVLHSEQQDGRFGLTGKNVVRTIAAAGVVNYVDAVAVTDGVIALTTSARQSDGSAIAIQLSPNVGSDAALNWVLTGNGCQGGAGSEAGRVVNCSGS